MHTNQTTANDNIPLSTKGANNGCTNPYAHSSYTDTIENTPSSLHRPAPLANSEAERCEKHSFARAAYKRDINRFTSQNDDTISVSQYSPIKTGVRIHRPKVPSPVSTPARVRRVAHQSVKLKRPKTGRIGVYALLLLWILGVAAIARFAGGPNDATLVGTNLAVAIGSLGGLSLWLATLARRRKAKFSYSIGAAGACLCLTGLAWYYYPQTGFYIHPELMALGISGLSLGFARLWKTPFLLHISLFIMIGWSAYSFFNTQVSELAWLFPALWSMQMFFALEFNIKRSIYLSIFAGLLWIGINLVLLN